MSLEEIKSKVIGEAETKAEARVAAARDEADSIKVQSVLDAEDLEERLLRRARQEAEGRKERMVTDARLASRKSVLVEKQAILDDVFNTAMDAFLESGEEFREALLQALLNSVETGEETLVLPELDRDAWGTKLVDELNRELSARGRKGTIQLADADQGFAAGVILRGRGVELNLSADLMMRQIREQLEERVSHQLFGGENTVEMDS